MIVVFNFAQKKFKSGKPLCSEWVNTLFSLLSNFMVIFLYHECKTIKIKNLTSTAHYLQVHGGIDSSGPMLAQICHRQTEPLTISSTGNTMFIRFRTDLSSSGRGFQAYYETSEQGSISVSYKNCT